MEEKVLAKSKRYNVTIVSAAIALVGLLIFGIYYLVKLLPQFNNASETIRNYYRTPLRLMFGYWDIAGIILLGVFLIFLIIAIIVFFSYKKVELTVTDKRVYGRAKFGKRVDLPFDSISAVGTSAMKGIDVATASGSIKFKFIENNMEIHKTISKLLLERQGKEKPVATATIKQEIPQSNADELKKYKDLLDSGVITQEEFDAKKKQLLGL